MGDIIQNFDQLKAIVEEAGRTARDPEKRAECYELLAFLSSLQEDVSRLIALQTKFAELQEQLAKLGEPPLQYGVFLGICPRSRDRNEDGPGRQALWAHLDRLLQSAIENEPSPGERDRLRKIRAGLKEIQAQVETERDIIVGVQGQRYEVKLAAGAITPDDLKEGQEVVLNKMMNVVGVRDYSMRGDTAEVVNIISPPGTARVLFVPDNGGPLQVQWPDGDRFEVSCSADLREKLRRGDIVQVDPSGQTAVAKVKPRLHIRSGGSEGIIVEISNRLFEEGVEIGDIVRVDTRLQFAFEKLPSYQTGGLALEEVPDVTFEDIGGLDEQIEEIRDAIELPYIHRKLFEEYHLTRPKGILLYGPPGCGKTMIAKAIANSLTQSIRAHLRRIEKLIQLYLRLRKNLCDEKALEEYLQLAPQGALFPVEIPRMAENPEEVLHQIAEDLRLHDVDLEDLEGALQRVQEVLRREDGVRSFFLNVKGPELLSKWVGESEYRIRKIFEEAKRNATFCTPVVIFFDEMEALFRTRGSGRSSDVETTIVPQFLSEMDGVESSENVIIIGASNRHDMIDPAILRPGRLDIKIKVGRPNREAAMNILALYLTPDLPLHADGLCPGWQERVPALNFRKHIVKRTLYSLDKHFSGQIEDILSAIPDRCDIRRALAQGRLTQWREHQGLGPVLAEAAKREQLAEALIAETVNLLFSPYSYLEVTTSAGKHHVIPLREFVSGAMLASVVSRAKKVVVKRRAAHAGAEPGISIADLYAAVREEFEENAEQLAISYLDQEFTSRAPGQPGEMVQFVEVHLGEGEEDPWSLEKARPYRMRPVEREAANGLE